MRSGAAACRYALSLRSSLPRHAAKRAGHVCPRAAAHTVQRFTAVEPARSHHGRRGPRAQKTRPPPAPPGHIARLVARSRRGWHGTETAIRARPVAVAYGHNAPPLEAPMPTDTASCAGAQPHTPQWKVLPSLAHCSRTCQGRCGPSVQPGAAWPSAPLTRLLRKP